MEYILCPDRLNINPKAADAEREYKYLKTTFKNLITECQVETPKKLHCLIKYISTTIYELILGGACGVIVIVVGNGHGDTSSSPGQDWFHFT